MKNYNSVIKKCIKNKYQASTVFNKNFIHLFFKQRNWILNKINLLDENNVFKISKNDQTLKRFTYYYYNKKINLNILKYYKKFEINLSLKKRYNKKFKKASNIETENLSYIYLGLLVNKTKYLKLTQKLNCIMKIIDKVSTSFTKFDRKGLLLFKKLILIEKFLLKKIS